MPNALHFPFPEVPGFAEPLEVAEGVYWVRLPLPFALDHINVWLLRDGDGWALVDTGIGAPEVKELWERLLQRFLAGQRLTRIIVTHFHPDHIGLAQWLAARFDAPVVMTPGEFQQAVDLHGTAPESRQGQQRAFFAAHGLSEAQIQQMVGGNPYRSRVPQLPDAVETVGEGDSLLIGGRRWQVREGRGHSPQHLALYCADLALLISGDQLLPRISTNISVTFMAPDGNPLADYLTSLEQLADLPAETLVLPAHGRPFVGIQPRVRQLQAHHRERLELLYAASERPRNAAQALPVLFSRPFDSHELFFALGEALAHYHHLWFEGRIARQADDRGGLQFQQAS